MAGCGVTLGRDARMGAWGQGAGECSREGPAGGVGVGGVWVAATGASGGRGEVAEGRAGPRTSRRPAPVAAVRTALAHHACIICAALRTCLLVHDLCPLARATGAGRVRRAAAARLLRLCAARREAPLHAAWRPRCRHMRHDVAALHDLKEPWSPQLLIHGPAGAHWPDIRDLNLLGVFHAGSGRSDIRIGVRATCYHRFEARAGCCAVRGQRTASDATHSVPSRP